jgi:hypothetical protein
LIIVISRGRPTCRYARSWVCNGRKVVTWL